MKKLILLLLLTFPCALPAEAPQITIVDIIQEKNDGSPDYRALEIKYLAYKTSISNINLLTVEYNKALNDLNTAQVRFSIKRSQLISALDAGISAYTNLTNSIIK